MVGIRNRLGAAALAAGLVLLQIPAVPVVATEPDGPFALRAARASGPDGEALLEIVVEPHVAGMAARLEYLAPASFELIALSLPFEGAAPVELPAAAGWKRGELQLGDLSPKTPLLLRFALVYPEDAAAVLDLAVLAERADGTMIRDAIGFVVGRPGAVGRYRHGAVEYRAVPADPEELR